MTIDEARDSGAPEAYMSDDRWRQSTEGDLDPDLTEEAGYAYWDPPRRGWLWWMARAVAALMLVSFIAALLLQVLYR